MTEEELRKAALEMGFVVARPAPNELYQQQPGGYSSYAPWLEMDDVPRTAMPKNHSYYLRELARCCVGVDGDFVELGVYRGGSAKLLQDLAPGKMLHLFDTFSGMPEIANKDRGVHKKGDFSNTSLAEVSAFVGVGTRKVRVVPGALPDTLQGFRNRIAFLHCDLDLYESTLECLRLLWPLVTTGGIALFDEYGLAAYKDTERRAVDEFFADRPERPICLSSGQAFVIAQGGGP